MTVTAAFLVKF